MTRTKKSSGVVVKPVVFFEDLSPWKRLTCKENVSMFARAMLPTLGSLVIIAMCISTATTVAVKLVDPFESFVVTLGGIIAGSVVATFVCVYNIMLMLFDDDARRKINVWRRHPLR